jgi:hypothetical protein
MAEATDTRMPSLPRVVAFVLAAGAGFWGVLLLLSFGLVALLPLHPFGWGYIVLAGYVIRAASCPTLGVRRAIWWVSIVVQGGWLCVGLADGLGRAAEKPIPRLWWAFATVASVAALVTERTEKGTPNQPPQQTAGA